MHKNHRRQSVLRSLLKVIWRSKDLEVELGGYCWGLLGTRSWISEIRENMRWDEDNVYDEDE